MQVTGKTNQRIGAIRNRRLVLRLLWQHRQLSRRQIADMTGLQGSTLTYIMRELLEQGVVQAAGKRDLATVGKKQELLEINANVGWVVGVNLGPDGIELMAFDLAGNKLVERRREGTDDIEEVVRLVGDMITDGADEVGPAGELLGVGAGVSGVIDRDQGVVLYSNLYECRHVDLRGIMQEVYGVPVIIDHNANMAALAEARIGTACELENFVYYLVQRGAGRAQTKVNAYGAALYINGELYRGRHYAAGELDRALAPGEFNLDGDVNLDELADSDGVLGSKNEFFATQVGRSISHIINFMDPEAVVLGTDFSIENPAFMTALKAEVNRSVIPVESRELRILGAQLGAGGVAHGSAIAVIEQVLWGEEDKELAILEKRF